MAYPPLPTPLPREWARPADYPENPSEIQMRRLVWRLLVTWFDRVARIRQLEWIGTPGLLEHHLHWIAEQRPRILELMADYIHYEDTPENWMPVLSAIQPGYSLTGLDQPEKLREVWEECNLLDQRLHQIESLAALGDRKEAERLEARRRQQTSEPTSEE